MSAPQNRNGARAALVLAAMTIANAMILVDQTAMPLTLPEIMHDYDIGSSDVQWVLTASLLPLAGLLVLGGRLGDELGLRRVFLVGAVLFAGASAIGGLAPIFEMLLAARLFQGVGGALMLPCSVAIVSETFPEERRGRALGTMGGIAAIAGALGPTIGGVLTEGISWRAVLLVNTPLAIGCVLLALRTVPGGAPKAGDASRIDVAGALLLFVTLVTFVYGLANVQTEPAGSLDVLAPVGVSILAGFAFVTHERRTAVPLMSFRLLRRTPDYLGATISQGLAGMAEMGLGVLFPLLLILNLQMDPALAGLALIPTTLPMVVLAPLAGRWYDRVGGRAPLATGFAVLAISGVALAIGVGEDTYAAVLPGLLLYGIGLALVLTVNDPVSLDQVDADDQGQASGVSATAEQGGGAIGIAFLYALFHTAYIDRLDEIVNEARIPDLDPRTSELLARGLQEAEETGLRPDHFDPSVLQYLEPARDASDFGYAVAFVAVAILAIIGLVVSLRLVRRRSQQTATA